MLNNQLYKFYNLDFRIWWRHNENDLYTCTLKTLDLIFHIGSTPTFLYFELYQNTAYAANTYVHF